MTNPNRSLSSASVRAKSMSGRSRRFPRVAHALVIGRLSFVMSLAICSSAPAAPIPTGQRIFQTRCFVCHGRDGRGSGPASQGLPQKPQDLTDPTWQRNVTDDQIRSVIQAGGAIVGKSGAMPPNPDLSSDDLNALVAYVRQLSGAH